MKYLLYTIAGFSKKYPLQKSTITIGRDETNDIVINNEFISRKHVNITLKPNSFLVEDAGSANGIFVNNKKVKKAELKTGESFKVGEIIFSLETGETSEFTLSEQFSPDFIKEPKYKESKISHKKTKTLGSVFKGIEIEILQKGLNFNTFNEFISYLSLKLAEFPGFGVFFLVEKQDGNTTIHLSINADQGFFYHLKEILETNPSLFRQRYPLDKQNHTGTDACGSYCAEPLVLGSNQSCLVYFPKDDRLERLVGINAFLISLAKMIEFLYKVIEEKKYQAPKKVKERQDEIKIITHSETMKALIQQAKKMADSDVFVLIEGESGTGKELFARLIHRYSQRDQEKFVALNCAAIPENLLESELFGYEKGAFTGAYNQKKGKLELASGGTLVLDEISDMPLNLQAKLLRALQELEFYRLGGSIPIKVNLRIISLTHQNLEELIKEKKFREDLYYRLVHRTITIPPLRERREDIPALINYFTNKFCQQRNRFISGYSVKAFEALVNFNWNGNVRELENEINCIVNLTDDGERVDFDILSEKIKKDYESTNQPALHLPSSAPKGYNLKPEPETIIEVLKKHRWNKSRAAKELNMTYHGLHKKMKKMGIKRDNSG
ncbi:MAG: sigma 54-interacting transcriptional regulator [Candidatus Aminicenantes bacterium]|nr:MAG: sigma 54-interacting transcriptional regulator [Candidatus Aminicenantes bacterium]